MEGKPHMKQKGRYEGIVYVGRTEWWSPKEIAMTAKKRGLKVTCKGITGYQGNNDSRIRCLLLGRNEAAATFP